MEDNSIFKEDRNLLGFIAHSIYKKEQEEKGETVVLWNDLGGELQVIYKKKAFEAYKKWDETEHYRKPYRMQ